MAIKQERMLALISDAQQAVEIYDTLRKELLQILGFQVAGVFSTEETLDSIKIRLATAPAILPLLALAVEAAHFAKHGEANIRKRVYAPQPPHARFLHTEQSPPRSPPRSTPRSTSQSTSQSTPELPSDLYENAPKDSGVF